MSGATHKRARTSGLDVVVRRARLVLLATKHKKAPPKANNNKQTGLHIVGVRQCPLYRANMALNWIAPITGTASAAEHKQGAISRQRSCFGASVVCELGLSPHSESVPLEAS